MNAEEVRESERRWAAVRDAFVRFMRDEAGIHEISAKHMTTIRDAVYWGFVPWIDLERRKIRKVKASERLAEKRFWVGVRGDGFDAVKLGALNEALISAAQEAAAAREVQVIPG